MLKVPEHQVAGHKAKDGALGPLVDGSGKFYKPLQNGNRGSTELTFYSSLSAHPSIPLSFFPAFHGTQVVQASDGSGLHSHLVLQDLLSDYTLPSVIDIKIGSRTWYPQASQDYITKCLVKDRTSSSLPLGFRISGLKDSLTRWEPHRNSLFALSADAVTLLLKRFASSNADDSASDPDCVFANEVYGVVLERLLELKKWFEVQTLYHFYSCSLLLIYEKGATKGKGFDPMVKLVDFAHVVDSNGAIDHNFLGGLCSFIKFVKDVLADQNPRDIGNCISKVQPE
ncbi:inositol polyphosphate multikinase beta-like [Abrus precatorius]|uniref:Inositol polyphosphate multikinase n=1 Tax=Abrus precatorius TaxID=3816 RepID=A0A8B8K592_ABRPR|nr:inositol polyphosphate multikinase beta-like [Abrus precatorius]